MSERPPALFEKWPRQYAFDFIRAKTSEERQAALADCPVEFQEWVKFYITNYRERNAK